MSWFRDTNMPTSKDIEYAVGYTLGAAIVHDKAQQLKDIDLRRGDETLSVKFQVRAAETGNLSFEMLSICTATGETTEGNFPKCRAKSVVMVVPIPESRGDYAMLVFRTGDLHKAVRDLAHARKRLTPERLAANVGRHYDDAESWMVRIPALRSLATVQRFRYSTLRASPAYIKYCIDNRYGR